MKTATIFDRFNQEYNVAIEKGKSITIDCVYQHVENPARSVKTFNVGDAAKYNSYALIFVGKIVAISGKIVTIDTGVRTGDTTEIKRMKIADFCDLNWNFELKKVEAYNAEEAVCI